MTFYIIKIYSNAIYYINKIMNNYKKILHNFISLRPKGILV